MGCVYLLSSPSGKGYVGMTRGTASSRFKRHCDESRHSTCSAVQAALRKYGAETFSVETLFESEDLNELMAVEVKLIAELGTKYPSGYNLTDGGEGSVGLPPALERQRIARSAATRTGMPLSEAHKRALSLSHKGQPSPMRGRVTPPDVRLKQSLAAKERIARTPRAEVLESAARARAARS